MNLSFTLNDLPQHTRSEAVTLLKQQLADALDLSLQARQAHWNVKGPHFHSLHQLFEDVAETLTDACDVIAERAVQLGGVAEGTSQVIVRDSRLQVYDPALSRGSDHVRAIAASLARFGSSTREAIRSADKLGDAVTVDIFTQVSRTADTLLWKVSAHRGDEWDRDDRERLAAATDTALSSIDRG
jgi:starvation-inducible DNA-binding protein